MAHTRLYRNGKLVQENFPVADISDHLEADPANIVWLDLCAPTAADLDAIREEFGLHQLAVEDAIHPRQRPKLDRYTSHLFLAGYVVHDAATGELTSNEIAAPHHAHRRRPHAALLPGHLRPRAARQRMDRIPA